jgi:putative membrane protein
MMYFVLRALVVAAGLWVASKIVPGVVFVSWTDLALAAVLLGIANALIRPVLFILTLPVTVVTLGLFIFVVNGLMVGLVDWLLKGFATTGLWADTLTAIVVGLVSWVASWFLSGKPQRR